MAKFFFRKCFLSYNYRLKIGMSGLIEKSKKIRKKSHGNRLLSAEQEKAVASIIKANLINKKIRKIKDIQELLLKYYNENRGSADEIQKVGQTTTYDILHRNNLMQLYKSRIHGDQDEEEFILEDPMEQKFDQLLNHIFEIKNEIAEIKKTVSEIQKNFIDLSPDILTKSTRDNGQIAANRNFIQLNKSLEGYQGDQFDSL
jgi:hypothetical protein